MQRIVLILAMSTGCETASPARAPAQPVALASAALDPRFVEAMRTAAGRYQTWGRVDDTPRVAPTLCAAAAPPQLEASQLRLSAAEVGPHGKKLYYLWASDRDAYRNPTQFPVGFTIVKESYAAVPASAGSAPRAGEPISLVSETGERLMIGPRKDLFVMTKVGTIEGADEGWVYGTVAVDGSVTSAGRVASCMGCHVSDASHERLFGLAPAPNH